MDINVVVVDDQNLVREGICAIINAQPEMTVVAEGKTADDLTILAARHKPHIIVSDLLMPGHNLFSAIDEARTASPDTNVVVVTGYITDTNIQRLLEASIMGCVDKAEAATEIIQAIKEVAAGRTYFSRGSREQLSKIYSGIDFSNLSKALQSMKKPLLSEREVEVLAAVAKGFSAKEVAEFLKISAKTVERHKSNIMAKLSMHSQVDLTRYAIREGIINA